MNLAATWSATLPLTVISALQIAQARPMSAVAAMPISENAALTLTAHIMASAAITSAPLQLMSQSLSAAMMSVMRERPAPIAVLTAYAITLSAATAFLMQATAALIQNASAMTARTITALLSKPALTILRIRMKLTLTAVDYAINALMEKAASRALIA